MLNAKLLEKVGELEQGARLHQMVDAIVAVDDDLRLPAMVRRIAIAAHSLVSASHTSVITMRRRAGCGRRGCTWAPMRRPAPPELVETWPPRGRMRSALRLPGGAGAHRRPVSVARPAAAQWHRRSRTSPAIGPQPARDAGPAAGVAVANSQLYDDARRRQAWLTASADVASTLLGRRARRGDAADRRRRPPGHRHRRRLGGGRHGRRDLTIESVRRPLATGAAVGRAVSADQATLFAESARPARPWSSTTPGATPGPVRSSPLGACRAGPCWACR